MLIENRKLLQFISGYMRYEENDGYLSFCRFTKKQAESLIERDHAIKVPASSSMFLEFITDGNEFSFDYRISTGSSQKFYSIDVLINGMNTLCKFEQVEETEGTLTVPIKGEGKKRVTVFFPNLAKLEIKNFNIDGSMEKHQRKLKYLALGDSITQGYCTKHPSLTYVNIVAQKLDAYVLNQAVGGDVFFDGNVDPEVKERFSPDLITVAYGTNDWSRELDVYSGASKFFKALKALYANTPIYALVPIHRNAIDGILKRGKTLEEARKDIEKAAEENGITVIDARDFVPYHEDFYCDKILHPNDLGFTFYGHNLYETIKKQLSDI